MRGSRKAGGDPRPLKGRMELGAGAKNLKYIKVEKCEYHPEGVKPLIAMGETHGKERLKTIALGPRS
ncbi:hypothetical protein SAMN04489723_111109 [Algoriphagus aquimarinus]|uniref:Uncharacterized protein n=1 Tax=Algoriphagus aquimarinus TaxID=237018 RepID=A0A1I1B7H5_9BACT|nr:hypothetical protein SAMN04489723_111109 [Algoriphagus aquimarinus]